MSDVRGNLTPRASDIVEAMRFSGGFGQPDGFSSVLEVMVRKDGSVCLRLLYSTIGDKRLSNFWAVELTNEQRFALQFFIGRYQPRLFERFDADTRAPTYTETESHSGSDDGMQREQCLAKAYAEQTADLLACSAERDKLREHVSLLRSQIHGIIWLKKFVSPSQYNRICEVLRETSPDQDGIAG